MGQQRQGVFQSQEWQTQSLQTATGEDWRGSRTNGYDLPVLLIVLPNRISFIVMLVSLSKVKSLDTAEFNDLSEICLG